MDRQITMLQNVVNRAPSVMDQRYNACIRRAQQRPGNNAPGRDSNAAAISCNIVVY